MFSQGTYNKNPECNLGLVEYRGEIAYGQILSTCERDCEYFFDISYKTHYEFKHRAYLKVVHPSTKNLDRVVYI